MAFKGLKKEDVKSTVANHFEVITKHEKNMEYIQIGRPFADPYKKQDKRIQYYISQEMIDTFLEIAIRNGCKDVTAYAKKLFVDEFEKIKNK